MDKKDKEVYTEENYDTGEYQSVGDLCPECKGPMVKSLRSLGHDDYTADWTCIKCGEVISS